jgi:hypothetical protein
MDGGWRDEHVCLVREAELEGASLSPPFRGCGEKVPQGIQ